MRISFWFFTESMTVLASGQHATKRLDGQDFRPKEDAKTSKLKGKGPLECFACLKEIRRLGPLQCRIRLSKLEQKEDLLEI